jgi:hypothetical protein
MKNKIKSRSNTCSNAMLDMLLLFTFMSVEELWSDWKQLSNWYCSTWQSNVYIAATFETLRFIVSMMDLAFWSESKTWEQYRIDQWL